MHMKKLGLLAMLLIGLGIVPALASGQQQIVTAAATQPAPNTQPAANTVSTPDKSFADRYPRYKLQAGDSFDISFELSPEFNQTATVQPDGYVTLRGIGDVQVKGQTVPELTATLRTTYSKILNEPLINVVLKDFEKPYFIADGQVAKPGKYDLRGDTTLTQAVAMAGGFLDTSKHSRVVLYRKAPDGWYAAQFIDVKKMEKQGNLHEDPQLHAGDMLFVPKNSFSKVRAFIPTANLGAFHPF
jgi:polysaccharide export outer membrane protein